LAAPRGGARRSHPRVFRRRAGRTSGARRRDPIAVGGKIGPDGRSPLPRQVAQSSMGIGDLLFCAWMSFSLVVTLATRVVVAVLLRTVVAPALARVG
jgi:hypothetical protein